MPDKTFHIVPSPKGGWNVKRGGAKRASRNFSNKKSAVDYGRKASKKRKGELVVHRKDGTIQRKASHKNDPYPPRDKDTH